MFSFTAKNVPWYHVIVDTEGLSDEAIAKRKTELIDIAVKQGSAQASPALSSSDISGSTTSPAETPTDTQRTELRVWLDEYSSVGISWSAWESLLTLLTSSRCLRHLA